jgi:hypothetical protein
MASVPAQTVRQLGAQTAKLAVAPLRHSMLRVSRGRMRGRLLVEARVAAAGRQRLGLGTAPRPSRRSRIVAAGRGRGNARGNTLTKSRQTAGGAGRRWIATEQDPPGDALAVVRQRNGEMSIPGSKSRLLALTTGGNAWGSGPRHLSVVPTN